MYIVVNSSGGVSAHASITDAGGGGNFNVAVNNVLLQYVTPAGSWATVPASGVGDYDGWHPTYDTAAGKSVNCQSGGSDDARRGIHAVPGGGVRAYTIYSSAVVVSC